MIQYREIPVSKLTEVGTFPKDRALIASINRVGLMQPIVVKRHGTGARWSNLTARPSQGWLSLM
jgi:hypothetical protein